MRIVAIVLLAIGIVCIMIALGFGIWWLINTGLGPSSLDLTATFGADVFYQQLTAIATQTP